MLQVLGISIEPPRRKESDAGKHIPFYIQPSPVAVPSIAEPLPVPEFVMPTPVPGGAMPGAAAPEAAPAAVVAPAPPVHAPPVTPAPIAPATAAGAAQQSSNPDTAAMAAAPAPGYLEAINAAMRGESVGNHPVLDAPNPGPEGYMGTQVHGSVGSASAPSCIIAWGQQELCWLSFSNERHPQHRLPCVSSPK